MTAQLDSRGNGQTGQPTWWASWVVHSASLQLRHAAGVVSRIWTLRVALAEPARLTRKEAATAKPWLCRIGRHRWQRLRKAAHLQRWGTGPARLLRPGAAPAENG